jgi:hypothetical protein
MGVWQVILQGGKQAKKVIIQSIYEEYVEELEV